MRGVAAFSGILFSAAWAGLVLALLHYGFSIQWAVTLLTVGTITAVTFGIGLLVWRATRKLPDKKDKERFLQSRSPQGEDRG